MALTSPQTLQSSGEARNNCNVIIIHISEPLRHSEFQTTQRRSQQPSGLRHELSSLARRPGLWVRIPHKAWMFGVCMCLFCVCVVLCLGRGLATSWSLVQGVLPSVQIIMKLKEVARSHGGCRASEKKKQYKSVNRAVYTTIISTNKNKSILNYRYLFIGQRRFATCFDIHEVIIRRNTFAQ
jgi:hypothetical protein